MASSINKRLLADDPAAPLLPFAATSRPLALWPLFAVTFLNTAARIVSQTPAFALHFRDIADASGHDAASSVVALGRLTALRSLVELAATPVLARWSDRVGRKRALCLCAGACCLEHAFLAYTRSFAYLAAVHVAGGVFASHSAIEGSCIIDVAGASIQARGVAFVKLFVAIGAALIIGPTIGGELSELNRVLPFVFAAAISVCSILLVGSCMPEYLPKARRNQPGFGVVQSLGAFGRLIAKDKRLMWYMLTIASSSLGMSAFITIRTPWAQNLFGWDGHEIGRVVSLYGVTLMAAQFVVLPLLLRVMQGREGLLVQFCLLVHTARFTAYSIAPTGSWLYPTMVLSTAGSCSVPVLQALCSRCVQEGEQGLLSGGASALNTAFQAIGSIVGSEVYASTLRGGACANAQLMLSAACFAVAAACVLPGQLVEAGSNKFESWVPLAEGMHGSDASVPGPTARGSMLLRRSSYILRSASDGTPVRRRQSP
mmetsp:Transcript_104709/g.295005  ORF Transcript_104709/g.295005 Transcript_104709/m.295005 type:complete len:486 (-) Transcript_104709:101-1558(-)